MNASELALSLIDTTPPPSYKLRLALGVVTDKVVINASQLPLTLVDSIVPPSNALPLALVGSNDNGGGDNGNDNGNDDNDDKLNNRQRGVMAIFACNITVSKGVQRDLVSVNKAVHIAYDMNVTRAKTTTISYCNQVVNRAYTHISNCYNAQITELVAVSNCYQQNVKAFTHISNAKYSRLQSTISYQNCKLTIVKASVSYSRCNSHLNSSTIGFTRCLNPSYKGRSISNCGVSKTQHTVPVPCRYYPIPEPPPIKPKQTCKPPPPSSELPLILRSHGDYDSSNLPLPLTCWHDVPTLPIPNKDTYIMHNTINATIGGINVEPLSFSIKSDMDGYCWLGKITISPADHEKIKHKLTNIKGEEPLINVSINNHRFAFIAEEPRETHEFINQTYSLGGRSLSARLGADYAMAQGGLVEYDNYASQIVQAQLNDTPISLDEFAVNDWLIPADSYSVTDKTMIAVINDIADACGGFIVSHNYDAKLSIKKRYKKSAWELATATPDVIVPEDVIKLVDNGKRINPRYNTVTLTSHVEGGIVYRELQGRDMPAPVVDNALFTDQNCIVAKGTQILSDSGTHGDYQLILPWHDDEQIPLAELGDIWQVNGSDGAWKGIVTSVSVDVKVNNDVAVVWQRVGVDRYLDN